MQAKPAPGLARPSFLAVSDLLAALGDGQGFYTASDAFDFVAQGQPRLAGLSYARLGLRGLPVVEPESADAPALVGAA
jgi:NADH-quinone oxidoreductase subunit G